MRRKAYLSGLRDGLPIAAGYFAVAFTLGIYAKNCGLTAFEATLSSVLTNASAGQYAVFTLIRQRAAVTELILMTVIINARYLLMSCALSQRLSPDTPLWARLLLGHVVTDEIFAISVQGTGTLDPAYSWGAFSAASPCWALGTALGVMVGSVLPAPLVNALSVGLYGMFIAIVVPPAGKSRVLAAVVGASAALSFAFSRLLPALSEGMRTVLLTLLIAGIAAILHPVKEENAHE